MSVVRSWYIRNKLNIAIILATIVIVLLGINFCLNISASVLITKESTILVFVGILATFVVISNYFQLSTIQKDIEELKILKKENDELRQQHVILKKQVEDLQKGFELVTQTKEE